jgi:hypothetical protein
MINLPTSLFLIPEAGNGLTGTGSRHPENKTEFEEQITQNKKLMKDILKNVLTLEALLRNLSKSSSTAALEVLIGISTNVFES